MSARSTSNTARQPRHPRRTPAAAVAEPAPPAPRASGSSAERSLRLLGILAEQGRALTQAELAQHLALPKVTTHRLCAQLLAAGYLARDVDERRVTVGPALRRLGLDALNHGSVRGLRHEVLSELVQKVGETCNLTTRDGASVLYLDRVEAPWPWRLSMDVGVHVPLHCTASGKLFLALMPRTERDVLIKGLTLQRLTPHTITSARALAAECDAIAERGHATDSEEFITGLVALAVPVHDAQGAVRAALAVHAPVARLALEQAASLLPALRAASRRMSDLL